MIVVIPSAHSMSALLKLGTLFLYLHKSLVRWPPITAEKRSQPSPNSPNKNRIARKGQAGRTDKIEKQTKMVDKTVPDSFRINCTTNDTHLLARIVL